MQIIARSFSVAETLTSQAQNFTVQPFYFKSKPFQNGKERPMWGMTLLGAGTMRFRWNESNENRDTMLRQILKQILPNSCSGSCVGEKKECDCKSIFIPVELIHSKKVIRAEKACDTKNIQADGIITNNRMLIPTVTVADCVPIFLYDTKTGARGAFHSGWKGTGIAGEGVKALCSEYHTSPENICAAIGPHIGDCCYFVDEERAEYFAKTFGESCVSKSKSNSDENGDSFSKNFPYKLSLTEANLSVLRKAGIHDENITFARDCTCCTKDGNGQNIFGSFRRQAAFLPPEVDAEKRSRSMTVQAAFVFTK